MKKKTTVVVIIPTTFSCPQCHLSGGTPQKSAHDLGRGPGLASTTLPSWSLDFVVDCGQSWKVWLDWEGSLGWGWQELAHAEVLGPSTGSLDTHRAPARALNETGQALERLRLRLGPPGSLQGKLRLLEQESEQQELQIRSFESDLAEVRADKQNLEAILQSLPESCASWQ